MAIADGRVVCACLVTTWNEHSFVSYVMTGCRAQGQRVRNGNAAGVAEKPGGSRPRHRRAFITEGNTSSEAMFYRVGAERQPTQVFHIAENEAWASRTDTYAPASFIEEGFIHCSTVAQLDRVANDFFAEGDDLTLLTIAAERVGSMLVFEDLYGASELFPHIYGPLPLAAVVEAVGYSVP